MSKIKKIVSLILILFLTISININLTMKSVKAGQERSGDWEYSINKDGTISINGYLGNNLDINIPNNIDGKIVTKLGDYAFSNSKIRKVVMPNTINELGDYCFESSHNLSEVVFSNDLTKISNNCFNGCCSLIAIDIPDNITEIGYNAFYGTRLCQVNLPKNLKVIRTEAFAEIGNILSIAIPDSVNCIEENTFYNSDVTIFCNNNSYAKIDAENNNINYTTKKIKLKGQKVIYTCGAYDYS